MKIHIDETTRTPLTIEFDEEDSQELYDIVMIDLVAFLELFAAKNREYGGGSAEDLGPRGQFADIWRKIRKLKRFLWDGFQPEFESVDEILKDLIGHTLLTLRMLRRQRTVAEHPSRPRVPVLRLEQTDAGPRRIQTDEP